MSLITRRRLLSVPLALGAASLAACGGGSDDENTGDANVRLLNLMSDVASIDLWADSSTRWFSDAATDALLAIVRDDKDTRMRGKALFWLAQKDDPRVKKLIADLVLK